eukprot:1528987-Amphidinium_carterae.1
MSLDDVDDDELDLLHSALADHTSLCNYLCWKIAILGHNKYQVRLCPHYEEQTSSVMRIHPQLPGNSTPVCTHTKS